MIDKFKAQMFMNRGYIIDSKGVNSLILVNSIVAFFTLMYPLINHNRLQIVVYSLILLIYLIIQISFKKLNNSIMKRDISLYILSYLYVCFNANNLLYSALKSNETLNINMFITAIIVQFVVLLVFILLMIYIAKNKSNKEYKAIPYVSTGSGFIVIFILKHFVKIPQEYGTLILNLIFYSAILFVLYGLSNYIVKLYLAIKYDINQYTNVE